MPSPFPGMDPYLEDLSRWSGVHARLIAVIGEMLAPRVAPRFFVDSEDHVYILAPDDPGRRRVRPDIYVAEMAMAAAPRRERGRITTPTVLELPEPLDVRIPFLEVRDASDRQVVATIEVLSPINKTPGSTGRVDFLRKRHQIVRSTVHWIEIDLLRAGARTLEVEGRAAYYALLHRGGKGEELEAWFAGIREELPTIAVPLAARLPDVPLDLQEAVDTVYERYRYDVGIDYTAGVPVPSLSAEDAAWAAERLRHWRAGRAR